MPGPGAPQCSLLNCASEKPPAPGRWLVPASHGALVRGQPPAEWTHSVHSVRGPHACWGRDGSRTGVTTAQQPLCLRLHPQGPSPSYLVTSVCECRTHGAETSGHSAAQGDRVSGLSKGGRSPHGATASAGGTSPLGGREIGWGLSCSLNRLPGSPPAGPQLSAQGGHSPGAKMWAWGCRPGQFSWLCPGVGRPSGPQGPSDRDKLWPVLPPAPGALSLSGSPPPGDPLAKVPALPTADHPQAH